MFEPSSSLPTTGNIAAEAAQSFDMSRTGYGRVSGTIDPIGAALVIRNIEVSVDAMKSQYFQASFIDALG